MPVVTKYTGPAPMTFARRTPAMTAGTFSAVRKNIKWSATFPIPFVGPGDAGYSACDAAANTRALQESLSEEEGCYVQNGTVLYPNAIGTFGNMGRNIFRGPDFVDWDVSIVKFWKLNERTKLQFRAEFFNLLNHPIFSKWFHPQRPERPHPR
jgi:hypothetical protein